MNTWGQCSQCIAVHVIVCVCVISVPSVREADVSLFSFGHFLMPFDMNMNVIKSTPSSYSCCWATAVSGPENSCQLTAIRLKWPVPSWQWKLNRIDIWHLLNQAWQCLVCDAYLKGIHTWVCVLCPLSLYVPAKCVCDRLFFVCVCVWGEDFQIQIRHI